MIITPILTTSLIRFSLGRFGDVLFELGSERVKCLGVSQVGEGGRGGASFELISGSVHELSKQSAFSQHQLFQTSYLQFILAPNSLPSE